MMLRPITLAMCLLLWGQCAGAIDAPRPFETMRQIQDWQDAIAIGARQYEPEFDSLLARFAASLGEPQVDWTDRRNTSALAFYLLTGGDAQTARSAVGALPESASDRLLVHAAFSIANGGRLDREEQPGLASIDPRAVSPEVAGALALAQARVLFKSDPSAAIGKLRDARNLSPGGLVEEMSLRQELALIDASSDLSDLDRIVHRYSARFSGSVYAGSFMRRLEAFAERIWRSGGRGKRELISGVIEVLPEAARKGIALSIARSAIVHGDRGGAVILLDLACGDPQTDADVAVRCTLYRQLSTMFDPSSTPNGGPITRSPSLHAEDSLLVECAIMLASEHAGSDLNVDAAPSQSAPEQSEVVRRARAQIAKSDELLNLRP